MSAPRSPRAALLTTVIVSAPLAVLVTWPQLVGAQQWPVVAQLIAFRAPLAMAMALVAVVAGAVAIIRRRWAIAAGLALVMGAAALTGGGVLLVRGWGGTQSAGELTVLVWNTQGGASSPNDVARLADHLGEYERDVSAGSTPRLPSGVWRPTNGEGPAIAAVHPYPPLPGSMDAWSAGLRWVADMCDSEDVIVAGDLNATVDHLAGLGGAGSGLGECRDAAREGGAGADGTWPSDAPPWLAAPIDHVLVGSAWTVRGTHVVTTAGGGSDHRPLVAVLDPR